MLSLDDTIAAISTPLGEAGIGIVRLTGPDAARILHKVFLTKASGDGLQPRHLCYGHIVDPHTGEYVDEVLSVYMPAPHTYTRQDVVEINGHGGIVALRRILGLCLEQGARPAERGEFTARAFLNGRLDLAQAEAVLDLVQARTEKSLQAAVGQLAGNLSGRIRAVRAILVDALAHVEATIDFEKDEIPDRDIDPDLDHAHHLLRNLLIDADKGIIYRQGVRAAIVGRPNVGKSSLLNQLLRTSRAIVTDIPGTTRDTLEETLNLKGVPVVLVDTAGITAAAEDPIERLGIERSRNALAEADLALLVIDASQPLTDADQAIAALVGDKPTISILNKVDLLERMPDATCQLTQGTAVVISALTGEGLEALEDAIVETVFSGRVSPSTEPVVTSARHKQALEQALHHVDAARSASREGLFADLVSIDLVAAINALGDITGQTASDDLIKSIFSRFCIGK